MIVVGCRLVEFTLHTSCLSQVCHTHFFT